MVHCPDPHFRTQTLFPLLWRGGCDLTNAPSPGTALGQSELPHPSLPPFPRDSRHPGTGLLGVIKNLHLCLNSNLRAELGLCHGCLEVRLPENTPARKHPAWRSLLSHCSGESDLGWLCYKYLSWLLFTAVVDPVGLHPVPFAGSVCLSSDCWEDLLLGIIEPLPGTCPQPRELPHPKGQPWPVTGDGGQQRHRPVASTWESPEGPSQLQGSPWDPGGTDAQCCCPSRRPSCCPSQ